MSNLTQLRMAARKIFEEALRAVEPGAALRAAVSLANSSLRIAGTEIKLRDNQRVYAIAIGKAASSMALALDEILGETLAAGVMTAGNTPLPALSSRWRSFAGGHPEPNEQSLAASQACFDLLQQAEAERALIIFLISGGGSAMLEWPISDDVTLADLCTANRVLVTSGASIIEINAVRRAFSAIKGGRLAARASHCDQITLVVSDVPHGEERNVASGPTFETQNSGPRPLDVVERYHLSHQLPRTILQAMSANPAEPPPVATSRREHVVLLDNGSALQAAAKAARRMDFVSTIAGDIADQSIAPGCKLLVSRLEALSQTESGNASTETVCLVSGGEFACPVEGDGIGGRNLETALRLAMSAKVSGTQFVALCAGTDGIDGNSPAAGAIVDSTTIARAHAVGLDPKDFLARSDAYSFFVALGDIVATGITHTNVRDLRILLAAR